MHAILGEIWQCICLFCGFAFTSQMALLFKYPNRVYFDCKTKLCLIVPDRQGKYIFTEGSFCLQGIFDVINELDSVTSLLDPKHKHMMKSGAPPDKFGVLSRLFPIDVHSFTSRIDF